jgi:hypothetical protein
LKKEEEIANTRRECDERIKKNWSDLDRKKEEYFRSAEQYKA